jgi:REP element-mobilizing transposase RayT
MPSSALWETIVARALGYHLVKTTYGTWLPGDSRGHWSSAWDEEIGYFQPHHLHEGDPVRQRMAEERMKHPPALLDAAMIDAVADAVARCAAESDWKVAAATIEPTHMHLLMTPTARDVEKTAKWIAQETTKAVHKETSFAGPVWCGGKWLGFIFDADHWENTRVYIERHNIRRGLPARPWDWIVPS